MKYNNNKLLIDKISVDRIIKKFGTPVYCYSYNQIKENISKFQKNFIKTKPLICFAVKANNNIRILKDGLILKSQACVLYSKKKAAKLQPFLNSLK